LPGLFLLPVVFGSAFVRHLFGICSALPNKNRKNRPKPADLLLHLFGYAEHLPNRI
jgi:hypothetical protein